MSTTTPNYGFTLPAVNSAVDEDLWGDELNGNWSALDTTLKAISDIANATAATVAAYGNVVAYNVGTGANNIVQLTAAAKYPAADGSLITNLILVKAGTPADQSITFGTTNTFVHGLGAAPKIVNVYYVNTTTQAGYTPGDVYGPVAAHYDGAGGGGMALYKDATNVYARISANGTDITNKTTGTITAMIAANWNIRVEAFA